MTTNDSQLVAIDATDGSIIWDVPIPGDAFGDSGEPGHHRELFQTVWITFRGPAEFASFTVGVVVIDLARHHFGPEGRAANQFVGRDDVSGIRFDHLAAADWTESPTSLAAWTRFHHAIGELPPEERSALAAQFRAALAGTN